MKLIYLVALIALVTLNIKCHENSKDKKNDSVELQGRWSFDRHEIPRRCAPGLLLHKDRYIVFSDCDGIDYSHKVPKVEQGKWNYDEQNMKLTFFEREFIVPHARWVKAHGEKKEKLSFNIIEKGNDRLGLVYNKGNDELKHVFNSSKLDTNFSNTFKGKGNDKFYFDLKNPPIMINVQYDCPTGCQINFSDQNTRELFAIEVKGKGKEEVLTSYLDHIANVSELGISVNTGYNADWDLKLIGFNF